VNIYWSRVVCTLYLTKQLSSDMTDLVKQSSTTPQNMQKELIYSTIIPREILSKFVLSFRLLMFVPFTTSESTCTDLSPDTMNLDRKTARIYQFSNREIRNCFYCLPKKKKVCHRRCNMNFSISSFTGGSTGDVTGKALCSTCIIDM
jgi:hypothetical protein